MGNLKEIQMIIVDILQSAYDIRREKLLAERGQIWFNTTDNTIHIEGGSVTVTELYKQMQKEITKGMAVPKNLLGKQK